MPFKIDARKFLLTYPQCSLAKDQVLEALQRLGEVKYYTISHEKHQDGNLHVHVSVHFSGKIHSTNQRYFDIDQYHPDIKCLKLARDFKQAEAYCRKHGDFITNIEETISKRADLAKRLIAHGTLDFNFISENPEIIFFNYSSLTSFLRIIPRPTSVVCYPKDKRRHTWLYGPSNSGKTTIMRKFLEGTKAVEIPDNNDFQCDENTEVLFADEFKGNITVQLLNRLCDGHTQLNRKGGHTLINFPIIFICSNYSISECYSKCDQSILDTLYNRFTEYHSINSILPF